MQDKAKKNDLSTHGLKPLILLFLLLSGSCGLVYEILWLKMLTLVIGLGSGMTLGAVEQHPVKAVDVVEIEAAVVEANQHFRQFTGNSLDDERVNLIVADGRNHLVLTNRQYDVIISEPSNPWIAGMAYFQQAQWQKAESECGMRNWIAPMRSRRGGGLSPPNTAITHS